MEQRTVERFRKRAILVHWLSAVSFAVLLITGAIMFLDLTSLSGGQQIRTVHKGAAVFFVSVPVLFALFDPKAAWSFVREALRWNRDDLAWLRSSARFYSGREVEVPPQGYLNGDQRLWQLAVIVAGLTFMSTGILMWFFKLKIPLELYQGVLLAHGTAFVVLSVMFIMHFYLTVLSPKFEESLSAMVDGKVSPTYAREHYGKWYDARTGTE